MRNVVHLLLLFLLALPPSSLGTNITLSNVTDFTNFVNKVSSGTDYYNGTTVYLDSDITLNDNIDPIGNGTYHFRGVFDGQGHVISNLTISSSSSQYTGLFGYSTGLTIRNVVLDSFCSITCSYITSSGAFHGFVGGMIGRCSTSVGQCSIENSVNIASIAFNGNVSSYTYIGGIAAHGTLKQNGISIKNCVNYGSLVNMGTSKKAYIGGIVSEMWNETMTVGTFIQNCANYGTLTFNGTAETLNMGGIIGAVFNSTITNCVSAGKIVSSIESPFIGSIAGTCNKTSTKEITYCYWTNDAGYDIYGANYSYVNTTGSFSTELNASIADLLNTHVTTENGWSKWFTLHLNGGSINNLTQNYLVGIQGHFPDPVKEENSFLFWCKDTKRTEKFDPAAESVSGITGLYAAWVNNTVNFDFDNGTTVNVTFTYNTSIEYPENSSIVKEGYTFNQWNNYHEFMPARDIIVTALWTPNNYTVTLNVSGGGNVSEISKIITFNEKYGDLPEPTRTGYMFVGWFTEEINGTEVTNETIVTTPYNHTLYANWTEVTNQVKIVFNMKDLTEEDVEKFIGQYTKADFTIAKIEKSSESDEINVIIKFDDKDDAKEFVEAINKLGGGDDVKEVKFVFGNDSFSTMVYPLSFLSVLFL